MKMLWDELMKYYSRGNLLRSFIASLIFTSVVFALSPAWTWFVYLGVLIFLTLAGPAIMAYNAMMREE